ncbi:hypothetical protein NOF04DRAFT_11450 [Fusarium oxysporum II5]|uniref:Zn(2)-C6 fungal-type domain-containing protein n=2 Tax=Fusarium oxysporum species complex TaxID=171631 RepID=X0JDR7_FUSO5|nr:uncharacterized protein FOIG_12679 [Fusarium odoratissimum NRRL 54006]EXL94485.1 hypothetical protein FOIG_12679 [Fusarium odoratissimum NRRL 54006]KAK2122441.1 hypothetical protein NOF04DRAFT_11450 [Fusarium oxysporum II5]
MASLRRPHRKSRQGCRECKRRKVKCDEIRPSCFNCTRYSVQCVYGVQDPQQENVWSPPAQTTACNALDRPSAESEASAHPRAETILPNGTGIPCSGDSWKQDLELMHHYCTVTSNTMACQESARHVWRVIFPQEGYVHEYLMHGILSLAALHKAFLIPSQRDIYLTQSSFHHSIGQKTFTALLNNVTSANWQPIFSFATIVVAYVLSHSIRASGDSESETTPITKTLELFSVTKGIKAVLLPFIPQLNHTRLAPLVTSVWLAPVDPVTDSWVWPRDTRAAEADLTPRKPSLEYSMLPDDVFFALSCLRRYLSEAESPEIKVDYDKAVTILEVSAIQIAYADVNVEVGAILLWPFFLPDTVIADIRQRKPCGLVILAYYAVFVNTLDRIYWFLRGWGQELLKDIENEIGGQEQSREMLMWPRRHIGGK